MYLFMEDHNRAERQYQCQVQHQGAGDDIVSEVTWTVFASRPYFFPSSLNLAQLLTSDWQTICDRLG